MCINNVPSAILQYPNQREGVKESHSSSRHFCLRNEVQTEPASPPRAYTVLLVRMGSKMFECGELSVQSARPCWGSRPRPRPPSCPCPFPRPHAMGSGGNRCRSQDTRSVICIHVNNGQKNKTAQNQSHQHPTTSAPSRTQGPVESTLPIHVLPGLHLLVLADAVVLVVAGHLGVLGGFEAGKAHGAQHFPVVVVHIGGLGARVGHVRVGRG